MGHGRETASGQKTESKEQVSAPPHPQASRYYRGGVGIADTEGHPLHKKFIAVFEGDKGDSAAGPWW